MKSTEELAESYYTEICSAVITELSPYRGNLEVMRKLYAVIPAYIQGYLSTVETPQPRNPRPAAEPTIVKFYPQKKR